MAGRKTAEEGGGGGGQDGFSGSIETASTHLMCSKMSEKSE